MMHENPIFTRKQAYTKGWPFTWNGEELTDAEYGLNMYCQFLRILIKNLFGLSLLILQIPKKIWTM